MIRPFSHKDYNRNSKKLGDNPPCCICGKPIKNRETKYMIRVGEGGAKFLMKDAPVDNGDMGWFPIGSHCLKLNPELKEFTVL